MSRPPASTQGPGLARWLLMTGLPTLMAVLSGCASFNAQTNSNYVFERPDDTAPVPDTPVAGQSASIACRAMSAAYCAYQEPSVVTAGSPRQICPRDSQPPDPHLHGYTFAGETYRGDDVDPHAPSGASKDAYRDFAFVSTSDQGPGGSVQIIIAFRGTLPPDLSDADLSAVVSDWANDLRVEKAQRSDPSGSRYALEKGFASAFDDLWKGIEPEVIRAWADAQGHHPSVYVVGHSKGGPLAFLAAMNLRWLHIPVAGVYTFAAPRAGDADFAKLYSELGIPTIRYDFRDDVIPYWPFQPSEIDAIIGDRSFWQKLLDHFFSGIVGSEFSDVGDLRYSGDGVRLETVTGSDVERLNAWRRWLLTRERKEIGFEGLVAHAAQAHPLEGRSPPPGVRLTSYETVVCGP